MTMHEKARMLEALTIQLEALDLSVEDLVSYSQSPEGVASITLSDFYTQRVLPAIKKGSRQTWASPARGLLGGFPDLCSCFCEACMAHYKGDSSWTPCPCVTSGECCCSSGDLSRGAVVTASCLEHCEGLGTRPLADLKLADLEALARWAEMRAFKRTVARNLRRAAVGRPTHSHDGRSAVESLRNLLSYIYKLAIADGLMGVKKNLALDLAVKERPEVQKRSYSEEQVEELWSALFSSGSKDVELDVAIVWMMLETAARRGGPIGLRVSDLLFASNKIRLSEKNGKVGLQPATPALLAFLLSHAVRRGGIVIENHTGRPDEEISPQDVVDRRVILQTDAPVFYYSTPLKVTDPDGTVRTEPHPLTRRRFNSLFDRLKRELHWLDELQGRPHDFRKTIGTFVERAYGYATSQRFLRHGPNDVTGIYVVADGSDVEAAHRGLTGSG